MTASTAGSVRRERLAHPERFCQGSRRCMWRVMDGKGNVVSPCPRHPVQPAKTIDLMQALKDCLATARAADTNPAITDRIARYRVTRIMSHVVEGIHSLSECWEAIDLLAGPDEKCEHIVGVRNDEAFCFQHRDFTCDAPVAVQAERMRPVLEEPE